MAFWSWPYCLKSADEPDTALAQEKKAISVLEARDGIFSVKVKQQLSGVFSLRDIWEGLAPALPVFTRLIICI